MSNIWKLLDRRNKNKLCIIMSHETRKQDGEFCIVYLLGTLYYRLVISRIWSIKKKSTLGFHFAHLWSLFVP
jgi:hypothetical protein